MGLLKNKSWQAQDLYNEYLELKVDISEKIINLEFVKSMGEITAEEVATRENSINEKVMRLRTVLNQLRVEHNVQLEDLIILSLGFDI
ncbi:hypothetical protein JDW21_18865 [Bacillus subtilis]|uniref:Uncharacterized protein n=1 Tax=Bacillus phage vB_BsuS_PJN02 TaxID=2920374 RepID=A0AC61TSA0_9CAUD|nr:MULTISPECIES: hypothetical protein [Bacillus subtilis group]YP_010681829.1 hypothetical protein PQE76_gp211 [Bacillus phage vB_BsuS_PJN02]MCR4362132.1 hypothetical protein [Bacillus subtilis]UNH58554.1 hypothetical protein [Bacillus phage vB_BsuS_PJN02]UQB84264.1 hypothetical protein KMZ31_20335 [Bacillus amyloliquefaciens]WOF32891.1 hypothetical protein OEJ84_23620 [Bacillus subtilis]